MLVRLKASITTRMRIVLPGVGVMGDARSRRDFVCRSQSRGAGKFCIAYPIVATLRHPIPVDDFRPKRPHMRFISSAILVAATASLAAAQPRRPAVTPATDPLRFQFLGPASGGRFSAVA